MDSSQTTTVRVGTSGFSFADWRGVFYPQQIDRGKMLDFYVQHFPTVEINSTYYRTPHPAVMYNLAKKAPRGFDFMVKAPQTLTHVRAEIGKEMAAFRESLRPIADYGMLAGVLAQFPYSFRCSQHGLDYLSICREEVQPHPLFVEFRHISWDREPVGELLQSQQIGYVSVDEPPIFGLLKPDLKVTTDTGYIRLHGRNAADWWSRGGERYNYNYSPAELEEWRMKIEKIKARVRRMYVFFNNCYDGQAVVNALDFMKKLDV
ncbi:DUF72 domain-containing protein [candidate division GN15 bacterium]|uniref:DUF72 domain-containing protein n=2 Tax=candidate division GN15 bacterium TaxID=2072418 RepID=A0A855X1M2_9BACT|nr:MAG: DUF72 domain-containing protein [candidate division GN15 bacterium]